jgi:hypothetical protein
MQKYTFINPDTGKEEVVEPVRWRWVVYYADGTILKQYDDRPDSYSGIFHRFAEIGQHDSPVIYFQMVSDHNPQGFKLAIPNGADLIHFYRNFKLAGEKEWKRAFIFGWKVLIEGKVFKRLIAIRPDDTIALLDDDGRG